MGNYHPYGGVIGYISTNENFQKYKFEGKELDRTFGLDNYDIHARQYFAMAPMWDRIDPLAEKYYGISPYAFCGGDPVNFGDYNGMDIFDIDENGVILLRQPTKKKYDELYSMSTGEHIKVTDQSILHGLHSPSHRIKLVNGNDKVWTSSSSLEIVSVFFFLADNTNIEWSMSLYESGTAALGAICGDPEGITYGSAPAYYPEVDDASNEIAQIHSHINSDAPSGSYDENAANYMRKKNSDGSWASTTGNDQMIYEDKLRKRNNDYSKMPPHYLYLKNTNTVYQYDNYEGKRASFNKAGFNNIFFKKRR